MTVLKGKSVVKGISFGKLSIKNNVSDIYCDVKCKINDTELEVRRYENGKKIAIDRLKKLYDKVFSEVDKESAMIFEVHKMMIEDESYCGSILDLIRNEKVSSEYAVSCISKKMVDKLSEVDDEYIRERIADIKDVSLLLTDCIRGDSHEKCEMNNECIWGASDFTPSQIAEMNGETTKGILIRSGAVNSHACILAKAMNILCVAGLGDLLEEEHNGKDIILDGLSGTVYIEPDITTINRLKRKFKMCKKHYELLNNLKGKENITMDGKKIKLYANIGSISDLDIVKGNDAGGIGLFRSEFLYLRRKNYPSEEEQFNAYKKVLEEMENKEVIIRTLDIGADKKAEYFNLPKEDNPAMGYRAIRICLDRPQIFKQQLRAILRASAFGKVSIMFPMIISVEEFKSAKKVVKEVKRELKENNIPFDKNIKMGVMIETPAAVFISDELAREADFFSIGTNDLTQYSLAVDRQNNKVSDMYDPYHKSILRMIKLVADNAHKHGIWVGICGELATDENLTELFLSLDIDELSMSSPFILGIRKKVRETNVDEIREKVIKKFL
ncbi:MAG: phosphoenolpyruvate--protein phosphotransferase [Oscillospiraceae bacterium]|nr:phosphoenolpyruvate--protein phosphotransferase [Oscillospiraceae bacterium]